MSSGNTEKSFDDNEKRLRWVKTHYPYYDIETARVHVRPVHTGHANFQPLFESVSRSNIGENTQSPYDKLYIHLGKIGIENTIIGDRLKFYILLHTAGLFYACTNQETFGNFLNALKETEAFEILARPQGTFTAFCKKLSSTFGLFSTGFVKERSKTKSVYVLEQMIEKIAKEKNFSIDKPSIQKALGTESDRHPKPLSI